MMNEEDEAFNEIERRAKQRKEAVKVAITKELIKSYDDGVKDALEVVRDATIEEVAQHIEKLKGFGQDTVSSLAIYIREMKK
jgi:CHASE3 domain sensor protein